MKTVEDSFIRRAACAIIVIVSLVTISLMLSGGCGGDGGGSTDPSPSQNPTPPSPPASDAPPLCEDKISLSCPAADVKRSTCISDRCEIIDDSVVPPIKISTRIDLHEWCADVDCFTLECQDILIDGVWESPILIIDRIDIHPVGEDLGDISVNGPPGGRIILNSGEYAFTCGIVMMP